MAATDRFQDEITCIVCLKKMNPTRHMYREQCTHEHPDYFVHSKCKAKYLTKIKTSSPRHQNTKEKALRKMREEGEEKFCLHCHKEATNTKKTPHDPISRGKLRCFTIVERILVEQAQK